MKLTDINEIKEDGLLVFMPSGIQARIFNEGKTILVTGASSPQLRE